MANCRKAISHFWGLPERENPAKHLVRGYTSPQSIVRQLSEQPRIRLIDASGELTPAEAQLLQVGFVEV
jgi:hypothetical protein